MERWYHVREPSRWWQRRRRARTGTGDGNVTPGLFASVVEAFCHALGVLELAVREPGFDRPGPEALTDDEADRRLGQLAIYLPNGLYDGVRLSVAASGAFADEMLRTGALHCSLEAEGRLVVSPDVESGLRIGCERASPEAVESVERLGLVATDSNDPFADIDLPVLPAADDAYWRGVEVAAAVSGSRVPLVSSWAVNVENWVLVDGANVGSVRAWLRPRSLVRVYEQPLVGPIGDRESVVQRACVLTAGPGPAVGLVLEAGTGRLRGFEMLDDEELPVWLSAGESASAIGVYLRDTSLTAVVPDEDGVVRARWL